MEYLINVVMAASSLWVSAAVLFAMSWMYRNKIGTFWWNAVKTFSGLVVFLGLIVGLTSGSNTYKHTVNYDPVIEQRSIENSRVDINTEIVDRTRKPMSTDERKETTVDMRERVKAD